MASALQSRSAEWFWDRHANPKSGWSRTLTLPLIVYAVRTRRSNLLLVAIGFTVINPLLFPKPVNADAWMTKVVLAERYWREHDVDIGALQLLNVLNGPVTLYALVAAYRRDTGAATVGTALSMTLKFAFVAELVRRFEDDLAELDSTIIEASATVA